MSVGLLGRFKIFDNKQMNIRTAYTYCRLYSALINSQQTIQTEYYVVLWCQSNEWVTLSERLVEIQNFHTHKFNIQTVYKLINKVLRKYEQFKVYNK